MHDQRGQLGRTSSSAWLSAGEWESSAARNARGSDGVEQWLGSTLAPCRSFLRIGYDRDRGGTYRASDSAGTSARLCLPDVAGLSGIGLEAVRGRGKNILTSWPNWGSDGV